jgi:hypothetical protein
LRAILTLLRPLLESLARHRMTCSTLRTESTLSVAFATMLTSIREATLLRELSQFHRLGHALHALSVKAASVACTSTRSFTLPASGSTFAAKCASIRRALGAPLIRGSIGALVAIAARRSGVIHRRHRRRGGRRELLIRLRWRRGDGRCVVLRLTFRSLTPRRCLIALPAQRGWLLRILDGGDGLWHLADCGMGECGDGLKQCGGHRQRHDKPRLKHDWKQARVHEFISLDAAARCGR